MSSTSIILPTYNEAGNIDKLISSLLNQFKNQSQVEIVVVDDNSPDNTAKVVQKLINRGFPVKLFVRINQRGLATAIHRGIKQSSGKIIVLMDTDFNHQPKDVLRLLKPIIDNRADLVIGSRYIKGGGMHLSEAGAFQFLASKYGNYLTNKIILNLPVHESLSGFLAFEKKILKNLDLKSIFKGYGEYCIRLLYHANQHGFTLTEVPVVYGKRQYGQSKSKLFKMMIDYFITAIRLKTNL